MPNTADFKQNTQKSFSTFSEETNNDSLVKNYAFKLKLFSVHRKRDKSELKDEKEAIKRTLYKCPYCDKSYSSVTRYEVHLRTHTGEKPYGCTFCPKKFNEKGNLKAHLRVHTGERPFPCDFPGCGMRFKTKGQLNDHKHRHSNLRPFKCTCCSAAFNRKTRLKVHLMIHTGEKPFHCSFPGCGKNFREKGNLNSHMRKHFPKKKPIAKQEKEEKVQDSIKDSSKSTTSYVNEANDFIDKIYSYGPEEENDLFNLNELNLFYSLNEDGLDIKQDM